MTAQTKVALYQHSLKAANQGSCVRVSTRTGEIATKSSKLWWIELDPGMYSPVWTTIPQASLSSLDLVRYGCLQGRRSRQCSSPVYDHLCLWWQLWTLHFCKLMLVLKIGNVKYLKILWEGCVISAYIQIMAYCQLPWLNVTLKKYTFVCKINVILSSWPRCQATKTKRITMHGHKSKRQSNTLQ